MLIPRERGDTLIEVIFATAVLSLIIVIALSVMNAGTAQAERAVEGTFVRQGIDSQTAMLRFARDAYVDKEAGADVLWSGPNGILNQRSSSILDFSQLATTQPNCKPTNNKAFWLDTQGGLVTVNTIFSAPTTYAAPGNGMWIEATPTGTANYVDFYIYACWSAPNGVGNSTSGTVVRLYV
jgi:type II secretory pathway pseudopilin PulG